MNYKILNTSEFQKEIKHLSKKYPSLHNDFGVFLNQLSKNPFQGTPLGKNFYKVRLAISSKGKGKSGGARVITYLRIAAETILLIKHLRKSEKSTITEKEINERLKRFPI